MIMPVQEERALGVEGSLKRNGLSLLKPARGMVHQRHTQVRVVPPQLIQTSQRLLVSTTTYCPSLAIDTARPCRIQSDDAYAKSPNLTQRTKGEVVRGLEQMRVSIVLQKLPVLTEPLHATSEHPRLNIVHMPRHSLGCTGDAQPGIEYSPPIHIVVTRNKEHMVTGQVEDLANAIEQTLKLVELTSTRSVKMTERDIAGTEDEVWAKAVSTCEVFQIVQKRVSK